MLGILTVFLMKILLPTEDLLSGNISQLIAKYDQLENQQSWILYLTKSKN